MIDRAAGSTRDTRPGAITRLSLQVALAATALVGLAYLAASASVLGFVMTGLIGQVDARLERGVHSPSGLPLPSDRQFESDPGDDAFGAPFLAWTIRADGTILKSSAANPDLPAEFRRVSGPRTILLGDLDLRIAGAPVGYDYLVLGQSLGQILSAKSTLLAAQIGIAPVLLIVTFLGAVSIGRRAAGPIDRARRRQVELTAAASAELRAPLSIILAHSRAANDHGHEASWYRRSLEKVNVESKRMRRILDDLLWMARFDAMEIPAGTIPVDLGIVVVQAADRYSILAASRDIVIDLIVPGEGATVGIPAEWLDRLVGLLLEDSCEYSPDGSTVRVRVASVRRRVRLTVEDGWHVAPKGPDEPHGSSRAGQRAADGRKGAAMAEAILRATRGNLQTSRTAVEGVRVDVTWHRAKPE